MQYLQVLPASCSRSQVESAIAKCIRLFNALFCHHTHVMFVCGGKKMLEKGNKTKRFDVTRHGNRYMRAIRSHMHANETNRCIAEFYVHTPHTNGHASDLNGFWS